MTIMRYAKEVASAIIANQNGTLPQSIKVISTSPVIRKKTKTVGPTTEIQVNVNSPARIIEEDKPGGIEELVVISPSNNFGVIIESNGKVKLNKTWSSLTALGAQAHDISAFTDADDNYILNIKDYRWQQDIILTLRSTSGSFLFDQVYANWYVYEE